MSDPIQVFPTGLVDLLNIKQGGGRAVDQLLQDVRPTVDLTDIFAASQVVGDSVTSAALVQGSTLSLVVPNRQTWLVYAVGADLVLGDFGDFAVLSLDAVKSNQRVSVDSTRLTATIPGEPLFMHKQFSRPFVLTPGDAWRLTVHKLILGAAPSVVGTVRCRFARLGPGSIESFL